MDEAHHLEAVDLRQHQVQHDEGGILRARLAQSLTSVIGGHDAEALAFEVGAHQRHDLAVVVDDEDGPAGRDRIGVGRWLGHQGVHASAEVSSASVTTA